MGYAGLPGRTVLFILTLYQQRYSFGEVNGKDLYLEQIPRTWEDASGNCTLARFDQLPVSGVSKLATIKYPAMNRFRERIRRSDLLWVGTTATFTEWLELLGCSVYYLIPKPLSSLTSPTRIGHLAECYQFCTRHDAFGINKTHCICHQNLESYRGKLKNVNCSLEGSPDFKNDVYGTPYKNNFTTHYGFAIYRRVNLSDQISEDNFGECIRNLRNGSETFPCDSTDSSGVSWKNSVISGSIHSTDKFPRWSPYLRRILYHRTNEKNPVPEGSACVSVRDSGRSYETVLRPCDDTLPSICEHTGDSTDIPRQISTSGMPNSTLIIHQTDSDGDTTSPVLLGSVIGVACVLIVVTVIVIIIIKKSRRTIEREKPVSAPTENVYYSEMTEVTATTPTAINSIDYDTMVSVREEKKSENSQEYGRLLPGGESDVYNHTWDKPITEQLTDHVYSTTYSGNDRNLYDHTETSKSKLSTESGGDYGLQSSCT